jgi:hypothetical protein
MGASAPGELLLANPFGQIVQAMQRSGSLFRCAPFEWREIGEHDR